jgi:hypothetical protein
LGNMGIAHFPFPSLGNVCHSQRASSAVGGLRWTHFHEHTKKMDRQLTIMSQVFRRALGEIQPTIPEPSEEVAFVDISKFVDNEKGFAQGWPKGVPQRMEDVEERERKKSVDQAPKLTAVQDHLRRALR